MLSKQEIKTECSQPLEVMKANAIESMYTKHGRLSVILLSFHRI